MIDARYGRKSLKIICRFDQSRRLFLGVLAALTTLPVQQANAGENYAPRPCQEACNWVLHSMKA